MKFFLVFPYLDTETSWSFWLWNRRRWCPCCWWRCPRRPRAEWSRARRPSRWTTPWRGGSSWSKTRSEMLRKTQFKGTVQKKKIVKNNDVQPLLFPVPIEDERNKESAETSRHQNPDREARSESGTVNNLVTDLVPGQGLDHKICAMDVSDFCPRPSSNWWNFQTNPWIQFNTNYRAQIISK